MTAADGYAKRIIALELQEPKSDHSNPEMEALTRRIVSEFEGGMNNDLDVKSAFDSLYETIHELQKMRESLSVKDVKNIMNDLRRIDSVLQCIF